jgi:hypothetical protein
MWMKMVTVTPRTGGTIIESMVKERSRSAGSVFEEVKA